MVGHYGMSAVILWLAVTRGTLSQILQLDTGRPAVVMGGLGFVMGPLV